MCIQHQQRSDAAFRLDQHKTRSPRFWEVSHVEIVSDGGIKLNEFGAKVGDVYSYVMS